MKYTKYFSGVLRNQGVPNLNIEQYARLMNIVFLEVRLQELLEIKESIQNPQECYKYDVRIKTVYKKITDLTIIANPSDVMRDMIFKSK